MSWLFFISLLGIFNYMTIPKEQFPELVIPTIMVSTSITLVPHLPT